MKAKYLFLTCLFSVNFYAQVGINTTSPDASSMLDISSTDKGLLPPRIALTATNSASPVTSPATALMVYNTVTAGAGIHQVTPGYYYWDSSQWVRLITTVSSGSGWSLTGNSGTNASTNYIGTSDDIDVVFKRNTIFSGVLGTNNTSFGRNSFNLATNTGNYNTSLGIFNLNGINSGNYNTSVGYSNLTGTNSGSRNTVIGALNLNSNTSGTANIAIGYSVLNSNTTGSNNIAMGAFTSLYNNTTGDANISIGNAALYNNLSGGYNLAIGDTTLYSNTTASYNVGMGYYAMYRNTTGNNNTAIGVYSMSNNTVGANNTSLGNSAMSLNDSGTSNVAIGVGALYQNLTGNNNVSLGKDSGYYITGSNNLALGYNAQVPVATNSNQIRIGDTNISYAGTQVAWSITSDKRWKSNIEKTNLGLDFVKQLNPVSYLRNNDESKKIELGFIAQELEALLNKFGLNNSGIITKDDKGYYSVRYNDLLAPIVKAIQEQNSIIEKQKEENDNLSKRLLGLEERLKAIESKINK